MKQNIIKKLSDRSHIRLKSGMYIGSKTLTSKELLVVEDGKFRYKEVSYVPGLLKIIDEILDNSVDEAIRTNFQFADQISFTYKDGQITIEDNGRGVPIAPGHDDIPQAVIAFTEARAGSNFSDETKANGIGTNGVGSFLTNVFSTNFKVETKDGKEKLTLVSINGAESFDYDVEKHITTKPGTKVTFTPEYEFFGIDGLESIYFTIIENRLLHLAQSFPKIKFVFNGKSIKAKDNKTYLKMFSESYEFVETDNFFFAIAPNDLDDFRQFSYVNGLNISSGGSHIDLISNEVVGRLKEKLEKKFKTIKPGDIKNKLMIVCVMKEFPNLQFDSQTKERVTNSVGDLRAYMGSIDFDKFALRVFKNESIVSPITEVYKIKEELKRRQELAGLEKKVKKIKSEKYLASTHLRKYLVIGEGASAISALVPVLGRKEYGYYELKGKPLNAYDSDQKRFTSNEELTELYKIIQQEGYQKVLLAVDADTDGSNIVGLLLGFFKKYLPETLSENKILRFKTPIIGFKKAGKIVKWFYDFRVEDDRGYQVKYYKGLGSWSAKDLQYVIQQETIQNMMVAIIPDDSHDETLDHWLLGKNSDKRKEFILNNDFSLIRA